MQLSIAHVALVVRDYDEALDFYVGVLGFRLVEDLYGNRWDLLQYNSSSPYAFD